MPSIHHRHRRQQTPPTPLLTPQNDPSSKQENIGLAQLHLPSTTHKPPVSVSRSEDEEEGRTEDVPSTVPSIHHSPIIAPNVDDTVTPPAVPVNGPSSTSRSQDMPFTQNEIQMGGPVRVSLDPTILTHSIFLTHLTYLTVLTLNAVTPNMLASKEVNLLST